MSLSVGDEAPGFVLDGIDGATGRRGIYELESYRGGPVVVVFYPADNSAVCTAQLAAYTAGISSFDSLGAQVLAISPQSLDKHAAFAGVNGGFAFPLLSDPGKAVGREWGNLGLLDLYRRSTFVLDAEGIITYSHRYIGPGLAFKGVDELAAAVAEAAAR